MAAPAAVRMRGCIQPSATHRPTVRGILMNIFAKLSVNGPDAHPLFQHLKAEQKGARGEEAIKWNFTKFLVGPEGAVLKRYGSGDTPESIGKELSPLLK